ncbi:MAG: hypothetical protein N3D11_05625 [Candidatus Sumerlaeia bacterium]|nr:hypothetical protein [Candidatus Sumerlaeia bacterium]
MTTLSSRRQRTVGARALAVCVLALFLSPTLGFSQLGRILSATMEPCYRSSTMTLHLRILNSSSYQWGDAAHPAYIVDFEASWPPVHHTWMGYAFGVVPPGGQDAITFLTYGDIKAPPDRGTQNWVDINVRVPDAPGSNNYVSIGRVRVPVVVEEWPDLVAFGMPSNFAGGPGDPINIALRVTNMGPGPVVWPSWVEVRISTDTLLSGIDRWVASQLILPRMEAGESRDYFLQGVIPANAPPAAYYVITQTDVRGELPESVPFQGEANNVFVAPVPFTVLNEPLPVAGVDVVALSVSVTPSDGIPMDWVYVRLAARNAGNTGTPDCTAQVFLTTPTATGPFRVPLTPALALGPLAAGQNVSFENAYQVPKNVLPPGLYMIVLEVSTSATDGRLSNNRVSGGLFEVSAPDLVIGTVSFRPPEGMKGWGTSYSIEVINLGNRPAPTNPLAGGTRVDVYLSRYPYRHSSDYLWFSQIVPRLGPVNGIGQGFPANSIVLTGSATISNDIPPLDTDPAGYRILVVADGTDNTIEWNENNNVLNAGRFRILTGPDLVIPRGAVSFVAGTQGQKANLSVQIVNRGDKPSPACKIRIYLSESAWKSSDPVWLDDVAVPALDAGAAWEYSATVNVPAWARGAYRVIGLCDSTNLVAEAYENNNTMDLGALSPATSVSRWEFYR